MKYPPELSDFEHATLQMLVRTYSAAGIAELARLMEADIEEEDDTEEEDDQELLARLKAMPEHSEPK